MKITLIGGGSCSWTPGLARDFLSDDFFKGIEICLYDINEAALDDLIELCDIYLKQVPKNHIRFRKTTDLKEALSEASYVIAAISNGGLEPELEDHRIARKYGFYNIKGSEVGIAGCSRTLRHVPEFVRIARKMEKYCPDAMLLNVTNPLTAITRCVNKYTSIKSYGFCHGVVNHLEILLPFFGADSWNGVEFTVAGVDHCTWQLEIKYRGKDALQIMRDKGLIEAARQGRNIATFDDPFAGAENQRLRFLLWDIIGYLPAISDEHCAEFFGQFMKSEESRKQYGITYDRIADRTMSSRKAKENVKNILEGTAKPNFKDSGEILHKFIAALNGGGEMIGVVNAPNRGQIGNLPKDTVVETRCLVDANGVHPIIAGDLPPILDSIVRPVAIREELYMEAAIEKNVKKLRSALSMDPLMNDFSRIDDVCQELMDYNRQFM